VITFKVFPIVAISAVNHRLAGRRVIIFHDDILDDTANLMRACANTPSKVTDGVVDACFSSVTHTLHSIAGNGADGGIRIAGSHKDGVSRVTKMKTASTDSLLVSAKMVAGRCRKAKALCGHSFSWGLERDDRDTVGERDE